MTHKAEQVLVAFKSTVTGLATTGANTQRGRLYDLVNLPALVVEKGIDARVAEKNMAVIDRILSIKVTAVVQAVEELESSLNQIAAEVYASLMADHTMGLDFVIDLNFSDDGAPVIETGGETPIALMEMTYDIMYRHSYASTEA